MARGRWPEHPVHPFATAIEVGYHVFNTINPDDANASRTEVGCQLRSSTITSLKCSERLCATHGWNVHLVSH
jgi:hypothetical protein